MTSQAPRTAAGQELRYRLLNMFAAWERLAATRTIHVPHVEDPAEIIRAIEAEAAAPPAAPSADQLAQIIREEDGDHSLGAAALAERIVARLPAAPAGLDKRLERALIRYADGRHRLVLPMGRIKEIAAALAAYAEGKLEKGQ